MTTPKLALFARLTKVDEEKRLVFGVAAEEVVDKADEIMDYASSKPHFQKWSDEVSKDTDGKSVGNLRAMHGKIAAGKLTEITYDDAAKRIDVCAKVVDDAEWKKVLEGVYTGFSLGGSYVGDATAEKMDGREIKRYTAAPNELSLVDRPCIPTAKFLQIQKADGSTVEVPFKAPETEVDVMGDPEDIVALGKLMIDSSLSVKDVIERVQKGIAAETAAKAAAKAAEAPAAVFADAVAKRLRIGTADQVRASYVALQKIDAAQRAETVVAAVANAWVEKIDNTGPPTDPVKIAALTKDVAVTLRKGLYSARGMIEAMCCLNSIMSSEAYEAYAEADNSPVPGMIKAAISLCGQIVKAIVDEEVRESPNDAAMLALAEQAGTLAKMDADALVTLVKALPAQADAVRAALPAIKTVVTVTVPPDLAKLMDERLAPLRKQLDEAQARIKKLADAPAPGRVVLRAIAKQHDVIADSATAAPAEPIVDAGGEKHEAAGLIKGLHRSGGQPLVKLA